MNTRSKRNRLPARSPYLARAEFVEVTGIHPARIDELLEMGWITAVAASDSEIAPGRLFREDDVYRVRKLERICADFELPALGGAIIVDLLERVDSLEKQVRELSGLLRR